MVNPSPAFRFQLSYPVAVVNANTVTVKLDNAQVRVLEVATAELVAGKTRYDDAMTHWADNVGTTTIRLIIVELKEHP